MLKVMRKNDRTVPMLCCDACGSWIDDAGAGAAVFASLEEDGDTKEVALVHKGACHDKTEAALRAKGLSVGWQELSRYLVDALHNTNLPFQKLQQMEDDDQQFGRL
ncbi:MAG: hypothetical protein ACD_23C00751G0014 [uncultured bacterium]|jgi:hypothetical protein|nr:MAG: hypothetical protein ACD_23C00751G0014 [uncultured bacterium]